MVKPGRVLVISEGRFPGADTVLVDMVESKNIVDYDHVILDVDGLHAWFGALLGASIHKHGSKGLARVKNLAQTLQTKLWRLIESRGTLTLIGSSFRPVSYRYHLRSPAIPVSSFSPSLPSDKSDIEVREIGFSDWCPVPFKVSHEIGETRGVVVAGYQRYFNALRRWSFWLGPPEDGELLNQIQRHSEGYRVECASRNVKLAVNRYEQALGISITVLLMSQRTKQSTQRQIICGPLVVLPLPETVSMQEAIVVILEDVIGVKGPAPPPAWLSTVLVPGIEGLELEIASVDVQIGELTKKRTELVAAREALNHWRLLLSEQGKQLQDLVGQAFQLIGGVTKPPPAGVSDEFTVEWDGQKILVEVKGVKNSAAAAHVSQLLKDKSAYLEAVGQSIKGVLVVNAWKDLPPSERGTASHLNFPDNVVKAARENNVALVTAADFFEAVCASLEGQKETVERFVGRLLNDSGAVTPG